MSETRYYKGSMTFVSGESGLIDSIKEIAKLKGRDIKNFGGYDDWYEWLEYECEGEYFIYKKCLYEVNKKEIDPESSIYHSMSIGVGEYEFELRYYDGSEPFNEALQEALERMEDKDV